MVEERRHTTYSITATGRAALRRWLDEDGAPPVFEVENLVRVFFADQGDADQLRSTIADMGAAATAARDELRGIVASMSRSDPMVIDRLPVNALTIRLVTDLHGAIERWAHWAAEVTADWEDTTRPDWDAWEVFDALLDAVPGPTTPDVPATPSPSSPHR